MTSRSPYEKLDTPEALAFLFNPRGDHGNSCPSSAMDEFCPVAGDTVHIRYHLLDGGKGPVIIFFHGNGEIVSDYDDIALQFNRFGISLVAAEYRGYGLSSGTPTATSMMEDAHQVFEQVADRLGERQHEGKLFVMGRSLGSAPAIELASSHPGRLQGLILDSAFATTTRLLATVGLDTTRLGLSEEDGFGNLDKIRKISIPTFMIHGQNDEIIPLDDAALLQAECRARQKELQVVPGAGHNTLFTVAGDMYFQVLQRFINRAGNLRPRRRPGRR